MQGDPRFSKGWGDYGLDGYPQNAEVGSYYGNEALNSFNGIELETSKNCPKNYVIFDRTGDISRVMFNPTYATNFGYSGAQAEGSQRIHDKDDRFISSPSFKEDSDEIDALLSLEEVQDEEDDDAVSTGRTPGDYSCNSPDTACSSDARKYGKQMCPYDTAASGPSGERKRARVKKMVKVLRGIVPGGQQMDTPAFLDEAVKYLKSLKMEVKKLGVQNSKK